MAWDLEAKDSEEAKETSQTTEGERRGRRQRPNSEEHDGNDNKAGLQHDAVDKGQTGGRKKSVWGEADGNDESFKASSSVRQDKDHADSEELPRSRRRQDASSTSRKAKAKNKYDDNEDDETEIMEIPDLEEEENGEGDITNQIAEAPRNVTRNLPSMKDLEMDWKHSLPTAKSKGVDLSLLTSALYPRLGVTEPDEKWDFDILLREVSHEIQKEIELKDGTPVEDPALATTFT